MGGLVYYLFSCLKYFFKKKINKPFCHNFIAIFDDLKKSDVHSFSKDVETKTLLIHGKEDQLVGIGHSIELFRLLKNTTEPAWVEGADHNNIYEFSEVWLRIMKFTYELFPDLYKKSPEFESHKMALLRNKEAKATKKQSAAPTGKSKKGKTKSSLKNMHPSASAMYSDNYVSSIARSSNLPSTSVVW